MILTVFLVKVFDDQWVNSFMNISVIAYQTGERLQKLHAFLRNLSTGSCGCVYVGHCETREYISTLQSSGEMLCSMSFQNYSLLKNSGRGGNGGENEGRRREAAAEM